MIEANHKVFKYLDDFCAARGSPIANSGSARWIASDAGEDKARLKEAELIDSLSFTAAFKVARFDHDGRALFVTVGFDVPDELPFATVEEVGGGVLTLVLSELLPVPKASTLQIGNVVGSIDKSVEGYSGHDSNAIAELFPDVKCFSVASLDARETFRMFFLMCLADSRHTELWMDDALKQVFSLIAELSPITIPYRTLCRSIFDTDPSAVFLALYRCLEALYAYAYSTEVIAELKLSDSWDRVAEALESTLGWYPREEQSLEKLLRLAVQEDLKSVLDSLGHPLGGGTLISVATKRIYLLRNSLVHYRPFHHRTDMTSIDWNRLCAAMALLVLHVYAGVYETGGGISKIPEA